jgi:beta-mannanase
VGATNVGWVWCPLAAGFDTGAAAAYYPGDADVDWLCADVYADDPSVPFRQLADSFLAWAAGHDRPVVFAEVGTQRVGTGARATWLREAADWIQGFPQVKGFVYFDSDVDRGGRIRRWSLQHWPEDMAALRQIAGRSWFSARAGPPSG